MSGYKYLLDTNLSDSEARIMTILRNLTKNGEIEISNGELGKIIGKSHNAMAKIVFHLVHKGYLKSINPNKGRILYILK